MALVDTSKTKAIIKFLNIPAWDKAGYTGKGITIMSRERVESQAKFPYVIALDGFGKDDNNHGSRVMEQMKKLAPDATYITCSKEALDSNRQTLWVRYILENNVHLMTTSKLNVTKSVSQGIEDLMQKCIDNGTTFFIGAGNKQFPAGYHTVYEEAKSEKYLAIGSAEYNEDSNGVCKVFDSVTGEELDYMMLVGFWGESGTSFATNKMTALMARVQQFFLEKAGRTLYRHELIKFIDDNLIDMDKQGFDTNTGKGLFKLPHIADIDIKKYCEVETMKEPKQIREVGYLHPVVQNKLREFVLRASNEKIDILVYETYRTDERQLWCYNNGTSDVKARGAHYHCIAFDCVVLRNGVARWDRVAEYEILGRIGKELGFEWGGDWAKLNDIYHFQYMGGLTLAQWQSGKRPAWWNGWEIGKCEEVANVNEPSEWAKEAWAWGVANKICDGTNPKGAITREQVVQMLYNFLVKGGK